MTAVTLGAVYRPQFPPEAFLDAVLEAERLGLAEVWLWEDCFLQGGLTSVAAALARTDHLTIGLGLMPVPLRNVAVAAMEVAAVERMFPGRFRLAVGHGVQSWMGQVGGRADSPLTLMREYVVALRALLRGEQVTASGRYVTLDGVGLDWPPTRVPPVLVGAVGPKSLTLAGEIADGVLLDADLTPAGVRERVDLCLAARAAAGVTEPFDVVVYQRCYRGPDATERLSEDARPGGVEAGIVDDPVAAARQVAALADAGARTVVLMPSATEPTPTGYLRFVGQDVRRALDADPAARG